MILQLKQAHTHTYTEKKNFCYGEGCWDRNDEKDAFYFSPENRFMLNVCGMEQSCQTCTLHDNCQIDIAVSSGQFS